MKWRVDSLRKSTILTNSESNLLKDTERRCKLVKVEMKVETLHRHKRNSENHKDSPPDWKTREKWMNFLVYIAYQR